MNKENLESIFEASFNLKTEQGRNDLSDFCKKLKKSISFLSKGYLDGSLTWGCRGYPLVMTEQDGRWLGSIQIGEGGKVIYLARGTFRESLAYVRIVHIIALDLLFRSSGSAYLDRRYRLFSKFGQSELSLFKRLKSILKSYDKYGLVPEVFGGYFWSGSGLVSYDLLLGRGIRNEDIFYDSYQHYLEGYLLLSEFISVARRVRLPRPMTIGEYSKWYGAMRSDYKKRSEPLLLPAENESDFFRIIQENKELVLSRFAHTRLRGVNPSVPVSN